MKRISYLLLLSVILSLVISSCSNSKTYADQLNDEKILIADYIKRNNIKVISEFPADSVFANNEYVLTKSGLYFRFENRGNLADPVIQLKDIVVPRYKQYTLDLVPDTLSDWSTIDYPYPNIFTYGDQTQSCLGFQEAVLYMKRNDTEAKIIVPSKLGFSDNLTSVTPMGYDLKIKIQK